MRQISLFIRASRILMSVLLVSFVASCDHRHGNEHDHSAEGTHDHQGVVAPVGLNDGEKWEADEHTLLIVEEMRSELADFDRSAAGSYHVLADSLTDQLNVLIAGCTMEGPAHDELHKWLVPVTQNVKDLGAASDESDARTEINNIARSVREFDDFFERKNQ